MIKLKENFFRIASIENPIFRAPVERIETGSFKPWLESLKVSTLALKITVISVWAIESSIDVNFKWRQNLNNEVTQI